MRRELIKIEGMTCQSCVARVSKAIIAVPGVIDVQVSLSKQNASFQLTDSQTKIDDVVTAVRNAGYQADQKHTFDWFYVWGFLILIILMMLSSRLQGNEQALTGAGYGLLFITGLLTSLHCVAMCGGITLSRASVGNNFRQRSVTLIQYHLGRIVSYSLIGTIMGAIGAIAAPDDMVKGIVTLVGGVGMALFALSGIFPRWFSGVRLPNIAANLSTSKGKWSRSSLGIGFINGFVPCGPLQGMQLFALGSGSALKGGLSMLIFALGTMPLLFGFGSFVTLLNNKFRSRLIKLGFIFVLLLAFMMFVKGIGFILINS